MKTLLLLLLTCLPLWSATTYPMLSDTTNRTVVGGVTNLSFLNSNSVFTGTARWMGIATLTNTGNIFVGDGSGLTGVGVATSGGLATNLTATGLTVATGQTNTHLTASSIVTTDANKGIISGTTTANLATLSANQTFTGTNTFNAFSIAQGGDSGWTNLRSFYRTTGLGVRTLFQTNFSLTFINCATNSTSPYTNNGLQHCSSVISFTSPALLGSNSFCHITVGVFKTNATTSAAEVYFWLGAATNFGGRIMSLSTGSTMQRWLVGGGTAAHNTIGAFRNLNSYTTQIPGNYNGNDVNTDTSLALVDTSVPFTIYIGFTSTTSATNIGVWSVTAREYVMSP